jgi:hypothetical protein
MLEYFSAMRHLNFHHFLAPTDMRIPVVVDDMLMRFFDNQLIAHLGAPQLCKDSGVLPALEEATTTLPETTVRSRGRDSSGRCVWKEQLQQWSLFEAPTLLSRGSL